MCACCLTLRHQQHGCKRRARIGRTGNRTTPHSREKNTNGQQTWWKVWLSLFCTHTHDQQAMIGITQSARHALWSAHTSHDALRCYDSICAMYMLDHVPPLISCTPDTETCWYLICWIMLGMFRRFFRKVLLLWSLERVDLRANVGGVVGVWHVCEWAKL